MKTISDALSLRNTILARLDLATRITNKKERKKYLTFAIAGAGPTGVELSGIIAEMSTSVIAKDYPELTDKELVEIYLIDGQASVLSSMSDSAQKYATKKLNEYGVNLLMNTFVEDFNGQQVKLSNGDQISSKNLIWAAGVVAKTFDGFPEKSVGKGKRLKTNQFNQVNFINDVFALGDCAIMTSDVAYSHGHPQLAQPAIQQATQLANNLLKDHKETWLPFRYKDKGSLAIIGRNKAVLDFPKQKYSMSGFVSWLIWIFVHIMGLVNFKNRLRTLYNWLGYYLYHDQSFRMIIKPNADKEETETS